MSSLRNSLFMFATILISTLVNVPALVAADLPTLIPGEPAPLVQADSWIKGEAIPKFEKDNIYVVEFWATWCPPCIESIPHLTKIQKKFKDNHVKVIGVSIDSEGLEKVQKFVEKQGEKMEYSVALDKAGAQDSESLTSAAYMSAAQQTGIPCAFIVNGDGKIAWIGYPLEIDEPLEAVIANKWDITKARDTFMAEAKRKQKMEELGQILQAAIDAKEHLKIIAVIDEIARELPDVFGESKWNKELYKFEQVLHADGGDLAYKIADAMCENCLKDLDAAVVLTTITTSCLQHPERKERELNYAIKCAEKANEISMGKDTRSLVILADTYHEKGDNTKAITTLKQAIDICPDPRIKPQLEALLKEFEEVK